jgi:ribonuclease HI
MRVPSLSHRKGESMSRIAYTDGACKVSNPGICSCAFVIYDGETTEDGNLLEGAKETFSHGRFLGFPHSNNFAEYQAVIMVLEWARDCGYRDLEIWCDSQLVVRQVACEWAIKHEYLKPLVAKVFSLLHETGSALKWLKGHNGTVGNERADEICSEILSPELKKIKERPGSTVCGHFQEPLSCKECRKVVNTSINIEAN